ncbi:MAG: hypothetical protein ILNGONEN_01995 [Syntrophorhabdaceae bacterium]|nr:hypothetical protein [Syntrophorhabdaceae bacterium]
MNYSNVITPFVLPKVKQRNQWTECPQHRNRLSQATGPQSGHTTLHALRVTADLPFAEIISINGNGNPELTAAVA